MTFQRIQEAIVLHQQGNLHEAVEMYQHALRLEPRDPDALNLLGLACFQLGSYQNSVRYLKKCIKIRPDFVRAHGNLGLALRGAGQAREALLSLRRAVALDPELAEAHSNLGLVLNDLGRHVEAATSFEKVLAIAPDRLTYNQLGNTLLLLERFSAAAENFRCAIEMAPQFALAHNNLGIALSKLLDTSGAEACFRRALEIDPSCLPTYGNLAAQLVENGSLLEAEALCRKALSVDPEYVGGLIHLAASLQFQGRYAEAESCLASALRIEPDNFEAHSNLMFLDSLIHSDSPESGIGHAHQFGRLMTARARKRFTSWTVNPESSRLRVGLVSGDLRKHSVGYFLEGVLAALDKKRIQLVAYPTRSQEDDLTDRLRKHFAEWKPIVRASDKEAAELIHKDGIHVLLDLSGHTDGNRLPLFAWKPAPVQASWLGYFGTTGVAEIDYVIADNVGVPESGRAHFIEKIWYLPDTRLCFTAPTADVPVASFPCEQNGFVTFGCFQNLAKIGDEVLGVWARVLKALPTAVLRLQGREFDKPGFAEKLAQRFDNLGISADRLALFGKTPREDYLAAYNEVDIILDTFPYPGGTTTCEALWMGVPTLTLTGDTLLARQGASLLTAAGLPEWIASSEVEYVEKAIAFSGELPTLAALRAGLRQQVLASPLFDAPRFARNLEDVLWGMWRARSQH